MSAQTVAFVGWLCREFPVLLPLLQEHLDDQNGEILPNVLLGEITRWLVCNFDSEPNVKEIVATLEHAYSGGESTGVSELVAVSFLENLPRPGEDGAEIRNEIGPRMKKQLEEFG